MSNFANPPIIRFRGCAPVHRAKERWPCCFCWGKRNNETDLRDESGTPICADCASRTVRKLSMPSFVVAHIKETMQ